jgi:hypothetical protein
MSKIGPALRDYLLEEGEGYPSEFFRRWVKMARRRPSYASVRRLFWVCGKLGLIEKVREEPSGRGMPRSIYRIVPGRANDDAWDNPQGVLLPETLEGRRYRG